METAYDLVKKCIQEDSNFQTPCLQPNNFATIGFMKAVIESNLKIGLDIRCISFDYLDFTDILGLNLSYVGRCDNMGELAAKMLMDRIANPQLPRRTEVVQPRLILKGSEKKT